MDMARMPRPLIRPLGPGAAGGGVLGTIVVISLGSLYRVSELASGGEVVADDGRPAR